MGRCLTELTESLVSKLRIGIYTALIVFSFPIFIGTSKMAELYREPEYICPLYLEFEDAKPDSNESQQTTPNGTNLGELHPSVERCYYPITVAIVLQLIYMLIRMCIVLAYVLGEIAEDSCVFSDKMESFFILVDFLGFFLTFIGACILTAGTFVTCNHSICSEKDPWVVSSATATLGAWISVILWFVVFVLAFIFQIRHMSIPWLASSIRGSKADKEKQKKQTIEDEVEDIAAIEHVFKEVVAASCIPYNSKLLYFVLCTVRG